MAKDGALPVVCLSPPTSSHTLGLPDGEVAGKIKEREIKTGNCIVLGGGGRLEDGLDCVCACVAVCLRVCVVVCGGNCFIW